MGRLLAVYISPSSDLGTLRLGPPRYYDTRPSDLAPTLNTVLQLAVGRG
jgi:hypothetical protein